MIGKDEFISTLEKMSRERFHRLCLELLENMGFKISSVRSIGGDFEAEAVLVRGDAPPADYIVRITRSGGDPVKEIRGLRKVMGPEVRGIYITTSVLDEKGFTEDYVDVADGDDFYLLMDKFDVLTRFDEYPLQERTLPSASEVDRLVGWGDEFWSKHNYHKAMEYYDKAITLKPDFLKPKIKKANVLLDYGEPESASELLLEAVENGMESSEAWTTLGKTFHALDRYEDEVEAYEKALDLNEDNVQAWNLKGAALYEKGLYDEAELCFDRVLEVEPRDYDAWNNKGLCLMKKGDLQDAYNAINNALIIKPDHLESLLNKALVLERQNKIQKALEVADALISIRPDSGEFHYIRAAYMEACNDFEGSYQEVRKALKLEPDHPKSVELKLQLEKQMEKEGRLHRTKKKMEESLIGIDDLEEDREFVTMKISDIERDIDVLRVMGDEEKVRNDQGVGEGLKSHPQEAVELQAVDGRQNDVQYRREREEILNKLRERQKQLEELKDLKSQIEIELDILRTRGRRDHEQREELLDDVIKDNEKELRGLRKDRSRMREELNGGSDKIHELRNWIHELEEKVSSTSDDEDIKTIRLEMEEKEKQIEVLTCETKTMKDELEKRGEVIEKLKQEKEVIHKEIEKGKQERETEEMQRRETQNILKEMREKESRGNYRTIRRIAELLLKMNEHQKVLDITSDVDMVQLSNIRGCAHYGVGDMYQAVNDFEMSHEVTGKLNLEEIHFDTDQYETGYELLESLEDDGQRLCVYWERKGECARRSGRYEDALDSYDRAVDTGGSEMEDILLTRARCAVETRGVDTGIEYLKKLVRIQKTGCVLNLLGTYHYINRDYETALRTFEKVKKENQATVLNNIGCTAYQMEDYQTALSKFTRATEVDPYNPIYRNNLGFCQLETYMLDDALENFSRSVELDKNDPVGWYNMGIVMKRLGDEGWKNNMIRSVKLAPDFKQARRMLKGDDFH